MPIFLLPGEPLLYHPIRLPSLYDNSSLIPHPPATQPPDSPATSPEPSYSNTSELAYQRTMKPQGNSYPQRYHHCKCSERKNNDCRYPTPAHGKKNLDSWRSSSGSILECQNWTSIQAILWLRNLRCLYSSKNLARKFDGLLFGKDFWAELGVLVLLMRIPCYEPSRSPSLLGCVTPLDMKDLVFGKF